MTEDAGEDHDDRDGKEDPVTGGWLDSLLVEILRDGMILLQEGGVPVDRLCHWVCHGYSASSSLDWLRPKSLRGLQAKSTKPQPTNAMPRLSLIHLYARVRSLRQPAFTSFRSDLAICILLPTWLQPR